MTTNRKAGIFFAALIVAIGGIIYEMIIGSAASFLLGNSILHFSLTIGLFLFGMGIGSLLVPLITLRPEQNFVIIEILLGLLGGYSVFILFSLFAFSNLIYPGMILLVLIIGAAIGTEIPLLLSILREESASKYVTLTSRILSLDYLGALIASIAFPIILLPQLGLLRSAFLVGMLNVLIALLMLNSFWQELTRKKLVAALWIVAFCLLTGGFVFAHSIQTTLNKGLFQDEVVYSQQSEYQSIVFTQFRDDLRLYLDGNIQFSSIDEARYHEALVTVPASLTDVRTALVLGGGDGLAVKQLLKYEQLEQIVLVDLDPAVTTLAQNYLPLVELNDDALQDDRVTIINQDAFTYLENTSTRFDLIIADLPDPNNESVAKLYSTEFYSLVKQSLSAQGVFVTQAASTYFTPRTHSVIRASVESAGLYANSYSINVPSFGEWGFVLGTQFEFSPEQLEEVPDTNTVLTSAEIARSLFLFSGDNELTDEISPSSLFDQKVLQEYEAEIRRWQ